MHTMLTLVSRKLTGENGELLQAVVELVDHTHHARSKAPSRNNATATTRSRQFHKLSFTIVPNAVLKRACI